MARKSRKNVEVIVETPIQENIYLDTAIYVRLSIENSGKNDDGDSIENQISFCKAYLNEQLDLKLHDVYADNGEKGTNFDRPEFNRMMDDVRNGKVKCIIVKDLSRFGRDYIETGHYLEKIFPFLGIRFISITDGYDSFSSDDAEDALLVPLKNMMNDVYAKDISRKIITSFRARQEKGEFLPAFAPYGYVKSETKAYRYEIDPVTAPYVKMIFEWKAEGVSHNEICKRLNAIGAVTPARRKVELGIWKAEKYKHTIWQGRSIIDIMKNPTYTGCIVYGRMPKSLYEGIKMHRASAEELRFIPNAHEPIVSQELFDKVQSIFVENAKNMNEKKAQSAEARAKIKDYFKGFIYCGDCGKKMRFIKPTDKKNPITQEYSYYVCGGYLDSGYRNCTRHTIRFTAVADTVLAVIKTQMEIALEQEKLIKRIRGSYQERSILDKYTGQVNYWSQELNKINSRRETLFENFADGLLNEAEYQFAKKKYDEEVEKIQKNFAAAKSKKQFLDEVLALDNDWIQSIHMMENCAHIDKRLVECFVKSIKVYEDNRIEIELKHMDSKMAFEQIVAELEGGCCE